MEIATVGVSRDDAWRLKTLLEMIRDAHLPARGRACRGSRSGWSRSIRCGTPPPRPSSRASSARPDWRCTSSCRARRGRPTGRPTRRCSPTSSSSRPTFCAARAPIPCGPSSPPPRCARSTPARSASSASPASTLMERPARGAAASSPASGSRRSAASASSSCAARATTAATASWWRAVSGPRRAVTVSPAPRGATRCRATRRRLSRAGGAGSRQSTRGRTPDALVRALERAEAVVDALLGTGLTGPAPGRSLPPSRRINESGRRGIPVIALDLPSGLCSDHGALLGPTVRATLTVTFAGLKRSLLLYPAAAQAGRGGGRRHRHSRGGSPRAASPRGGSRGRRRAPVFSRARGRRPQGHASATSWWWRARSARPAPRCSPPAPRSGAGSASARSRRPPRSSPSSPRRRRSYMTEALPETAAGSLALAGARSASSIWPTAWTRSRSGPGSRSIPRRRSWPAPWSPRWSGPWSSDADALSALAGHLDLLRRALGPRALTPHPGEMARMLGGRSRPGAGRPNRDRPELRAATTTWVSRSRARAP